MQRRRSAIHLVVADHPRAPVSGWRRQQKTPGALAKRARAMLLLADGPSFAATARQVERRQRHGRTWALHFVIHEIEGLYDKKWPGRKSVFSPQVAMDVDKLAWERPDLVGRSLSQWDSTALARPLGRDGVVRAIAPQAVQRIRAHHTLQPWRHHLW
jgi:hypothetical protein